MPRVKKTRSARAKVFDAIAALRIAILIAIPFYAAYDYGGVLPWTQWVLSLAAAAILLLLIPEFFGRQKRRPLTAMLVTVAILVAAIGFAQTVRLPAPANSLLSRGTKLAYTEMISPELRAEAAASDDGNLRNLAETAFPVSVSPARTRTACAVPIMFAVFVLAAACSFTSRERILVLLFALAGSGTVLAFVGIADRIQPVENRVADVQQVGEPFATFVNRNNAAAYLNLSLAAVAGCLIWRYRWQRQRRPWDDRYDASSAGVFELATERVRRIFAYADTSIILLSVGGAIILLGILVGGSRGGLLGVLAGTIVAGFRGFSRRQTWRYMLAVSVSAVALAIVLGFIGSLDRFRERTATIWTDDFTTTARWSHWQDSIVTAGQYFPLGSGLGSYGYAYLPYQQYSDGKSFEHADNMYLEMLVEGGAWLPSLIVCGFLVVVIALRRLLRIHDSPTTAAVVAATWYLIAAIGVSQMFDFAVLLSANYLTIGLLLGVLVGHADNIQLQRKYTRRRIRKKADSSESAQETDDADSDLELQTDSSNGPAPEVADIHSDAETASATRSLGENPAEPSPGENPVTASEFETDVELPIPQRVAATDEEHETTDEKHDSEASARPLTPQPLGRFDRITERVMRLFNGRLVLPMLLVGLLSFLSVIIPDADARAHVDALRRDEESHRRDASPPLFGTTIDHRLEQLENSRPLDATTQLTAANWRLLVDQSAAVRAAIQDKSHPFKETPEEAWRFADPRSRRAAFHSGETGAGDDPAAVLLPGQQLGRLKDARKNALRALLANPLDVSAREILIRLDYVAPSRDADSVLFDQIVRLRQNWSPTLHNVAKLAFIHPGPEAALPLWKRALSVDPQFLDIYWRDVQSYVDEETFSRAIPDSASLSLRFAEFAKEDVVRNRMLDRAKELLLKHAPSDEARATHHYSLGRVAEMKGNFGAAEMHYKSAVQANPTQADWRYRYVIMLEANGNIEEAKKQIGRCVKQRADNRYYLQKKRQLHERQ